MKIKDGFILREVAGNYIVVAVGSAVKTFNGVINLNQTGAFLWELLQKGAEKEDLVNIIETIKNPSNATMILMFSIYTINNIYGLYVWKKQLKKDENVVKK